MSLSTDLASGQDEPDDAAALRSLTSVNKALEVLDAFRTAGPTVGVSELARATGMAKSTVFRLLTQLGRGGYVEHCGAEYSLSARAFELGNAVAFARPGGLREAAARHLGELFLRSRYVVHLGVLVGPEVLYLDKLVGPQGPNVPSEVGSRLRASCSALGKVMLPFGNPNELRQLLEGGLSPRTRFSKVAPGLFMAELKRVHELGVAFDREEAALGVTCVAAPVLIDGRAVAAVSVSGPTGRFDPAGMAEHVLRAARRTAVDYAAARAAAREGLGLMGSVGR